MVHGRRRVAGALIGLAALPFAVASILKVRGDAAGKELIPALALTGFAELMWAVWLFAPLAR